VSKTYLSIGKHVDYIQLLNSFVRFHSKGMKKSKLFIASLYYLWIFDSVVIRFLIFMAMTLFLITLYISSFV